MRTTLLSPLHVDFKRGTLLWFVWCGRRWAPVVERPDGKVCSECHQSITERFKP